MTSRFASNTASDVATSSLFNRNVGGFSSRDTMNIPTNDTGFPLPNPNLTRPINVGANPRPSNGNVPVDNRPPNGLCNFHNMEYAINQRYRYNSNCHKNLRTLQQTIGEKKRPCLFDAARIFGGTECSREVFNGICSFHWSMLNLRVGVCQQYNTHMKSDGTFQHYEMLVDVALPDCVLVPIYPNVTGETSMWDLMYGFTYATNRGLLTTKINEGAAMAYALYYMMDNHCYVEFLARSTYWVQNMTEYLMAFVFYNDELLKDVHASRFPLRDTSNRNNPAGQSVLKDIFTKDIYVQNVDFQIEIPKIQLPAGMESLLNEKDARLVRNLPPQTNYNENDTSLWDAVSAGRKSHTLKPYKFFRIFVAPLILSLRPSTYVSDLYPYGAPPVIGVFNLRFKPIPLTNTDEQTDTDHSIFAMQGPIQYGVTAVRGNRNLPYASDMPTCTQAYVATLGSASNMDVTEDRIFASELARFADFSIPESDKLFTLNGLR